jgi:uncharacterized protein (DUF362 family)
MKRRQFIQNSLLATGGLLFASNTKSISKAKLAFIRGGSPANMLDLGMEALGGLEQFVPKGATVLVKPTLRWNQGPESGRNTNPKLLAHLVEACYKLGSRAVYLVDHTEDEWTKCYKNSGIERAVKDAGAKILPGDQEFLYPEVQLPQGGTMTSAKIHEVIEEVDLIINVPSVQQDSDGNYFGAFQNLAGLIWNQPTDPQSLIDFVKFKTPVLNIMDITRVPGKDSVKEYKTLVISSDIVAADSYAAKRIGIQLNSLPYLSQAEEAGLGATSLSPESIRSIILKNSIQ